MTFRLAGRAGVAIVAVSILVGTAACGSDEPGAERSDPVIDTSSPDSIASGSAMTSDTTSDLATADTTLSGSATTVGATEVGISEADVIELEQQLDEIDSVLADLEEQLAQD